jgi:repressor LexA
MTSKLYLKNFPSVLACSGMGTNTRRESAGEDGPDDLRLTLRQRKIIKLIEDSVRTRGYPPSFREIGEALGLASTSSIAFEISTLSEMGYLSRDSRRP